MVGLHNKIRTDHDDQSVGTREERAPKRRIVESLIKSNAAGVLYEGAIPNHILVMK